MNFVIQASDGTTEQVFMAYKDHQRQVRARVAMVWQSLEASLTAYDEFAAALGAGGELEPVAAYHAEIAAQLAGAEAMLLGGMAQIKSLIEQMQAAAPGDLFPGVPGGK